MWTYEYFALLSLLVALVQGVPAPGRGALEGYCNTNKHCNKGECCISKYLPRGKRGTSDSLSRFTDGKCQKLGTAGSGCLVNNQSPYRDIYYQSCPCGSGLACEGNGTVTVPLGEQGICEPKPCSSPNDCARNECCVSNVRPIGKRSTDQDRPSGHCEPAGRYGDTCLVRNGSGRPTGLVFVSCPCSHPLSCRGTGQIDIPLGEIGRCSRPPIGHGPDVPQNP